MKSKGRGILRSKMDKPRPFTQQHAAMLGPAWMSTAKPVLSGPLYTPDEKKLKIPTITETFRIK